MSSLHTITPKLRLNEAERKASLSCIRKSFLPGNCRMRMSMQMMEAPATHAVLPLARDDSLPDAESYQCHSGMS